MPAAWACPELPPPKEFSPPRFFCSQVAAMSGHVTWRMAIAHPRRPKQADVVHAAACAKTKHLQQSGTPEKVDGGSVLLHQARIRCDHELRCCTAARDGPDKKTADAHYTQRQKMEQREQRSNRHQLAWTSPALQEIQCALTAAVAECASVSWRGETAGDGGELMVADQASHLLVFTSVRNQHTQSDVAEWTGANKLSLLCLCVCVSGRSRHHTKTTALYSIRLRHLTSTLFDTGQMPAAIWTVLAERQPLTGSRATNT